MGLIVYAKKSYPLGLTLLLFLGLIPLIPFARNPSAVVVEMAYGNPEVALTLCPEIVIQSGSIHISSQPFATGKDEPFYASPGIQRLEDASVILILRTPETCRVIIGHDAGKIPSSWIKSLSDGLLDQWQTYPDGRVSFSGKDRITLAPHTAEKLKNRTNFPLRIYNYGRLEVYRHLPKPAAKPIALNSATTLYFAGPGDVKHFLIHSDRAGSLFIERTPGNMPWLTMLLGLSEKDLTPRGMMDMPRDSQALAEFCYHGFGPAQIDVAFLFSPDIPIQCQIEITQENEGMVRAHLVLTNLTGKPVLIQKPEVGTVTWLLGDEIIAAQPGKKPSPIVLAKERVDYEVSLDLPPGKVPTSAEVDLGEPYGIIACPMKGGQDDLDRF